MHNAASKVLTKTRRAFFSALGFTRTRGMYLAGGTALALHLGHRQSVYVDFYTTHHFKPGTLFPFFRRHVPEKNIKVARDLPDTFEINVPPDIHVSCFYYPYPLLKDPALLEGVAVAQPEDIAAMKIIAVTQRGRQRDYLDLYYLLQRFTLQEILRWTQEKYPEFDLYHGLRGLLYFNDADEDREIARAAVFDQSVTWAKVKKEITRIVIEFQKAHFL